MKKSSKKFKFNVRQDSKGNWIDKKSGKSSWDVFENENENRAFNNAVKIAEKKARSKEKRNDFIAESRMKSNVRFWQNIHVGSMFLNLFMAFIPLILIIAVVTPNDLEFDFFRALENLGKIQVNSFYDVLSSLFKKFSNLKIDFFEVEWTLTNFFPKIGSMFNFIFELLIFLPITLVVDFIANVLGVLGFIFTLFS